MTHYEERLDKDLSDIRAQIAEMAGLVDTAVKDAMHALQTGNTKLAAATVLNDHPINRMMRKIDAMCHKFIALHLPSAGHLRLLSSVIRANIELERIGDYAVTICREALQLSTPPHGHLATELERVGSETQSMLQSAIEAFNELNAEKARTIMMLEEHMENNLDIVYAELAANDEQDAVKNVLAIAAGISDGLGYGSNARAALITRGLAEIMRLGTRLGGRRETFMGLAGVGDLVLTCTDDQSRNRRLGLALGRGVPLAEAVEQIGQAVEGLHTAKELDRLARLNQVDMPITEQVKRVLYDDEAPAAAVEALLSRDPKPELA